MSEIKSPITPSTNFLLDKSSEQSFCSFFRSLEEKPEDTIRLFERSGGDFYTLHGEDAFYAAEKVYKTSTVIKYLGGDVLRGLPSCSLSRATAEAFLKEQISYKRIEIWSNIDGKKTINWRVVKKASPGNMDSLEELLFKNFDVTIAPTVLAINIGKAANQARVIGACFIDPTNGKISISEFIDNEIFSNFESLLIQTGALECLIPDNHIYEYDLQRIRQVLNRCNVMTTIAKKREYDLEFVTTNLNKLINEDSPPVISLPEYEMKKALESAACLISYLKLLDDQNNNHRFIFVKHDLSQYMKLDGSALNALHLVPSNQSNTTKTMTLYGLLNNCRTPQGSRLLYQWLKQPLIRLEDINERLDLVQALVEDHDLCNELYSNILKKIPDLNKITKKLRKGRANLMDVVIIYEVIKKLPGLIESLNNSQSSELMRAVYSVKLEEYYDGLQKVQELVETTVDLEKADRHIYVIKSSFDQGLQEISEKIEEIEAQFSPEHQRVARLLDVEIDKKLKFENSNVYGYCFRLSRIEATCLRAYPREFKELSVQKNGVYFTTNKMAQLSESHATLNQEYSRGQASLVKEVIKIVDTYSPVFEALNGLFAHLDLMVSFAILATNSNGPYVRPTFTDEGINYMNGRELNLIQSRHPCVEAQPDVHFIPNDIRMKKDEREFLIVTGPNMGGKSTFIRQVGMISLMAQLGSFVPCDSATLPIFDSILARVGANDSQQKGISTFMAEMLETATILKSATPNSLIIIDELGRGTSTYDGFGLAWSISEHISVKLRSMCLFATHFHELTTLANTIKTVANLHVVVHVNEDDKDDEKLTLLYKVEEGSCDQSFGIQVARMAKFPKHTINLAKRKVDELEGIEKGINTLTYDKADADQLKKAMTKLICHSKEHNGKIIDPSLLEELKEVANKFDVIKELI